MCSIMGLFINGTMGFGVLQVRGRSRVPKPPAMMTAFIGRGRKNEGATKIDSGIP